MPEIYSFLSLKFGSDEQHWGSDAETRADVYFA
jgi:hypothetical protein